MVLMLRILSGRFANRPYNAFCAPSLTPALLVGDLLLCERLGLYAQRGQFGAGDEVVYLVGDGLDAWRQFARVVGEVVGGERLQGEGEVHDLDRVTVGGGDVDEPPAGQDVQPSPVGELVLGDVSPDLARV
jgi:hypothetical protein